MAAIMLLSFQVAAYAATTWSNEGTIQLARGDNWKRNTTTGVYIVNTKTTSSKQVDVHSVALTMWNNPSFRIVNSNNEARCSAFLMSNPGKTATSNSNTGEAGYNYYASIKPSMLQTGTDTARLQFKSY